MPDLDRFERRLGSAIIADADSAIPGFDPASVSRAAIARSRRGGFRLRSTLESVRGARVVIAAAAVLAGAFVVAVVGLRGPSSGAPSTSSGPVSPIPSAGPDATPRGAWMDAGRMADARSDGLVAVALLDGRVLVVGGGRDLQSAELYDPSSRTWIPTGSTLEPRVYPTATLLRDGRVLLTGGSSARDTAATGDVVTFAETLASAELYDPRTGTWTAAGTMSQARGGHTATILPDGRVLVAGGAAPTAVPYPRFRTTEIYDPASGGWTAGSPMLAPRDAHTATLLQTGLVLVAGGHADRLSSVELYDPASGTWTSAAALPEAFAGHRAALLPNGEVLVSGGDVPSGPGAIGSAHAAIYDPGSDAWTMAASMITPRIGHQATRLADGDILVTGGAAVGSPDPDPYDSAELYDTATGAWIAVARMISPRTDHAAVLLSDGRVLVIGGSTGNGPPLASAELFTP